jgi:hypothetical protein
MTNNKLLFIVWASNSRRAVTLAEYWGGTTSFHFNKSLKKKKYLAPLRYVQQAWTTWRELETKKPQAVLVQTPPVFAGLVVMLWCKLRKRKYGVDAHSGSFYYKNWKWALPLQRIISRNATVALVAHEEVRKLVQGWGANAVFLEDKIPELPPTDGEIGTNGSKRVAIISSFDYDEPEPELFEAARLMPEVTFYHTGNWRKAAPELIAQKPANLNLTGFVSDEDYRALLHNVDGMVVLTTEPNLLNCGAYEALAVQKPCVISDWQGLREYFRRGFIYVKNTPQDIAEGVRQMLNDRQTLVSSGQELLTELESGWTSKAATVATAMGFKD